MTNTTALEFSTDANVEPTVIWLTYKENFSDGATMEANGSIDRSTGVFNMTLVGKPGPNDHSDPITINTVSRCTAADVLSVLLATAREVQKAVANDLLARARIKLKRAELENGRGGVMAPKPNRSNTNAGTIRAWAN
jgi:hypothetical protein